MLIKSNAEKNMSKVINRINLPARSRSYELCIKADALRFSKLYKESIKSYLDSIMLDRFHEEAYLFGHPFGYR